MPSNLHDRRVQRTRQLLRDALIKLVQGKGYSSISVQDLTNQANLGKATFYLHYKDKDELLYECMDSVLQELKVRIRSLPHTCWSANDPRPVQMAFEFVNENATFIRIMMHDPGGLIFFERLQKIVADFLTEVMHTEIPSPEIKPVVPLDFLSTYFAGALLAAIEWWVENDNPYSIAEMVDMVSKTTTLHREQLLGLKQA